MEKGLVPILIFCYFLTHFIRVVASTAYPRSSIDHNIPTCQATFQRSPRSAEEGYVTNFPVNMVRTNLQDVSWLLNAVIASATAFILSQKVKAGMMYFLLL
jgi:hypothetical protein